MIGRVVALLLRCDNYAVRSGDIPGMRGEETLVCSGGRPATGGRARGDLRVPGAARGETRFHVRASRFSRHGFVTACVRKERGRAAGNVIAPSRTEQSAAGVSGRSQLIRCASDGHLRRDAACRRKRKAQIACSVAATARAPARHCR
jgi:hypothetical protein